MENYRSLVSAGQTIGRYQLLRVIGRGGMGVVFEAIHPELGKRVAIKMVEVGATDDSTRTHERFLREAKAAAQTRHLHAVGAYDIGSHDGRPYIVMELLEGETLSELIAREAPLTPTRTAELILPILSAVMAAHDAGVVHRDLKPANIVLARRGGTIVHPVVTDFGISKIVDQGASVLTSSHAVLGTIHYIAPELTRSSENASPLSDMYSIGVILYECTTGQKPFTGKGPYELMHAIVTGSCPRPTEIHLDVPPAMESMILRAMNKDPEARYPSLRSLGAALLGFANAKTWAIWANEFHDSSQGFDATHSDLPESVSVASSLESHVDTRNSSVAGRSRSIAATIVGLALFVAGWVAARATSTAAPNLAEATAAPYGPSTRTAALLQSPQTPAALANDDSARVAAATAHPLETGALVTPTPPANDGRVSGPTRPSPPTPRLAPESKARQKHVGDSTAATELGTNDAPIIE